MGVSSQRMIVMLLLLNTMIALAADMYDTPRTLNEQYLTREDVIARGYAEEFKEEEPTVPTTDEQGYETTFGSGVSMGYTLIKAFFKGLVPYPITTSAYTTLPERVMVFGLNALKMLFWVLFILEAYLIIKNRKAT